jgi:hypothetical protein
MVVNICGFVVSNSSFGSVFPYKQRVMVVKVDTRFSAIELIHSESEALNWDF